MPNLLAGDELLQVGLKKRRLQAALQDPRPELRSVQTGFGDYGALRYSSGGGITRYPTATIHPANAMQDDATPRAHCFPPISAPSFGSCLQHAGATTAEPMRISELGCPDKPHRLEDFYDGSDIPQPARSMQGPATVQSDQCCSGVQELQAVSSVAEIQPPGTIDWDLLFPASQTEAITGQKDFQSDVVGGARTFFTAGDFSFNVLAMEDSDNVWSAFHANV